jgi:hypothetical protein
MREVAVRDPVPFFGRHFRLRSAEIGAKHMLQRLATVQRVTKTVQPDHISVSGVPSRAVMDQSGRTE